MKTLVISDACAAELFNALIDSTEPSPTDPPPTTPPPIPPGVRVITLPWGPLGSGNVRINTAQSGGFREETVAVKFTTPNATSTALAKIGAVESVANVTIIRTACLSERPGDLDRPVGKARSIGIGVSFTYGVGTASLYAANLRPATTYYLNIRNAGKDGTGTCPVGSSCDMFVELAKPSGL